MSVTSGRSLLGSDQVTTQGDNKEHLWVMNICGNVKSVVRRHKAIQGTHHLKAGL